MIALDDLRAARATIQATADNVAETMGRHRDRAQFNRDADLFTSLAGALACLDNALNLAAPDPTPAPDTPETSTSATPQEGEMRNLLITGDTYPHRHELRAAGARWDRDEEAWIGPNTTELAALAEEHELDAEETDEDVPAPPSYAESRARQHEKRQRKAERLAERAERKADKAAGIRKQIDADPLANDFGAMTQPIQVGHHSEGRHRRAKGRLHSRMDREHEARREAGELADKAERLAGVEADEDRPIPFLANRLREAEAHLRKVKRWADQGNDMGSKLPEAEEAVAYWSGLVDDRGGIPYGKHNVAAGDAVLVHRGGWYTVKKANPKTVKVNADPLELSYPWSHVLDHRTAEQVAAAKAGREADARVVLRARQGETS